ncbi:MAG TPA: nucleotidyltransferase family protein [Clostridiales bacterium]|nr:nucleotidyltransferase family protein [Clostridiales bacterium]
MKIAGIIAEYNPFHHGHKYHISQVRQHGATHVVAVMSGNFVQRGDVAITYKHTRAQMALLGGVDLVLELPTPWAMSTAQNFAYGAVSVLKALKVVDLLAFGCECGDSELLKAAADAIDSPLIKISLAENLSLGKSFASARQIAVEKSFGKDVAQVLASPNNTLAVEYIQAMKQLNANFDILAVKRMGAGHDQPAVKGDVKASASYIRDLIKAKKYSEAFRFMPPFCADIIKMEINRGNIASINNLERAILAKLRTLDRQDFEKLPDISEGLHNRIYSAVQTSLSLDELFDSIKTKRYSHARIRRLILSAFLGIDKSYFLKPVPYIRVLALNDKGRDILRRVKELADVPVVMRAKDFKELDDKSYRLFELESAATDLFSLSTDTVKPCGSEYTSKVFYIKKER